MDDTRRDIPQKACDELGWPQLLGHLAARCHTDRGAAAARALRFLDDPAAARVRIDRISEARQLRVIEAPPAFAGIHDIEGALDHADKGGTLEGPDLVAIGETVAACARLRRHLTAHAADAPSLAALAAPIQELSHVSGPILESFGESGRLEDHASAALGPMRRKVAALHDELGRRVRGLLDDPVIGPLLQDRFYTQREERYVVPVRAEARGRVKGIVHGTSQSGQTVFIEPEAVVDLNNRLKIAESDVAEEERRILAALTAEVRAEAPAIRLALEAAAHLDLLDAACLLAEALDATPPVIDDELRLELTAARHPLMVLGGTTPVPGDLHLAPRTTMIVSGPNAGGKTVALKTAGLAALMARAGLHLAAAPGSRIPFYRTIRTDIGDDQSLERNLSTFSAHIHYLREFLDRAGPATLLLIDEVAVGTDPEQGAALAQAVLEALAERGVHAIVTTHYERLKALAPLDARFLNASVGFDLERMTPTFRVHLGVPGSSGALVVARRLGLAPEVVARAEVLQGERSAGVDRLLAAVADERRRLEDERDRLTQALREAERAARRAEEARRTAEERAREARRGAHDEAVAALRQARAELDELKASLRRAGREHEVAAARARLKELSGAVARHAPPAAAPDLPPAPPEALVAGARVIVAGLGGRGVVLEPPARGRVDVQIGSLRTSVPVEEVRLDPSPAPGRGRGAGQGVGATTAAAQSARTHAGGPRPARASGRAGAPAGAPAGDDADEADLTPVRSIDTTLDVRGARVDEALPLVDRFLDDALLASRSVVFIIHGHGTGALRQAIREHLALHAAVTRSRGGTVREGGDGVTVAWLDV